MKTHAEVGAWIRGAAGEFGDPSIPVCQLFFQYVDILTGQPRQLTGYFSDGVLFLEICGAAFPIRVVGEHATVEDVGCEYRGTRVIPGVWSLTPSLNIEGFVHGFVVLYDVPDPAPWEGGMVLP